MRVLFVVPPLTGHVNPTVAIAGELEKRGHEVAWAAHPGRVRTLLPEGATLLDLPENVSDERFAIARERSQRLRGLRALQFLWEDFIVPLADGMVDAVRAHAQSFAPDLMVVDQQAIAGALVARQLDIPWATTVTTSAGVTDEISVLPKVEAWRDQLLTDLQLRHDLPAWHRPDLSPHQVLVLSTGALMGDTSGFGEHFHFVGPAFGGRRPHVPFPWDRLDDRPRVLVSLGTVNAERGARFYQAVLEAFEEPTVQVILGAPEHLVPETPEHIIRRDYIPIPELLPTIDLVICHGGHNTVCESLSHGVPLIITPVKDDQPVVARQVVDAGAGLRLKLSRITGAKLRTAVDTIRGDAAFAAHAAAVGRSFVDAGGAVTAVDRLEALSRR